MDHRREDPASVVPGAARGQKAETGNAGKTGCCGPITREASLTCAASLTCGIKEKTKTGEYLIADDISGVVGLTQMGVLEIHTWNSAFEDVERPNRIVFDLDPGEEVPAEADGETHPRGWRSRRIMWPWTATTRLATRRIHPTA